jgi:uncharacterized protein YaaW (UPF0174 family)
MPYNDRLFDLLGVLDETEIAALWTDAFRRPPSDESFDASPRARRIDLVSREWRAVHGHSLANLRRSDHELAWKRILVDVADKIAPGWGWTKYRVEDSHREEELEQAILRMYDERMKEMWEKLTAAQKEELAGSLDAEIARSTHALRQHGTAAAVRSVTVGSLAAAISAGLITGGGLMAIAQGSMSLAMGSLPGGVLQQLGFWMAVQLFGTFAGTRIALGSGASLLGGAAIAAPVGVALLAHAAMSTAYRKSVPATIMLLSWVELHRQLSRSET